MFDSQVPKIATDHPHSVYFSFFLFIFLIHFQIGFLFRREATAARGLPVSLFSADFFRVKGDELSVRDTITRLVYQRITSAMQLVFPTPYSLHSVTNKKSETVRRRRRGDESTGAVPSVTERKQTGPQDPRRRR